MTSKFSRLPCKLAVREVCNFAGCQPRQSNQVRHSALPERAAGRDGGRDHAGTQLDLEDDPEDKPRAAFLFLGSVIDGNLLFVWSKATRKPCVKHIWNHSTCRHPAGYDALPIVLSFKQAPQATYQEVAFQWGFCSSRRTSSLE